MDVTFAQVLTQYFWYVGGCILQHRKGSVGPSTNSNTLNMNYGVNRFIKWICTPAGVLWHAMLTGPANFSTAIRRQIRRFQFEPMCMATYSIWNHTHNVIVRSTNPRPWADSSYRKFMTLQHSDHGLGTMLPPTKLAKGMYTETLIARENPNQLSVQLKKIVGTNEGVRGGFCLRASTRFGRCNSIRVGLQRGFTCTS
jgi:hypothetical protein